MAWIRKRIRLPRGGIGRAAPVPSEFPTSWLFYDFQVEQEAWINGIKTAVEVYLVLAKTGKLPEKLPDHLPKDPFTGKDFGYEITDEGFALRCAGEEFKKRKKSLLEFRVCSK